MMKIFSRHLFHFQQEFRVTSYLENANMTFPYFLCKFTTMFGLGKNGLIVSLSRCKDSVKCIVHHVSLDTACVLTAILIAFFLTQL